MFVLLLVSAQTYFAFDSRAETEVYLRYGQHPELYPNRRGEIVQGLVFFHKLFFSPSPKNKWHLSRMINFISTHSSVNLFYLQLILRTWIPWLSFANLLCAVARLSWAVSTRIKMSVSLTYATAIYQALLTKWTIRRRWTEVGFRNILSINLIYFLHFPAFVSLHYTHSCCLLCFVFQIN